MKKVISFSTPVQFSLKHVLHLGGMSGRLLLGYPLILLILARRRSLDEAAVVDSSAAGLALYTVLIFLVSYNELCKHSYLKHKKILFESPLVWIVMYMCLCVVSSVWSVDPIMTFYRSFEQISFFLLIYVTILNIMRYGGKEVLFPWSVAFAFYTILVQMATHAKQSMDIGYILSASQFFAPAYFYLALFSPMRDRKKWLLYIFSILSGSTVSYLGMFLGGLSLFHHRKYKFVSILVVVLIAISVMVFGFHDTLKNTLFYDKSAISLQDTSGRNAILDVSIAAILDNPCGYGYASGEAYVLFTQAFKGAINAHNSFLSAGLGVGYLGIIILAMFFLHLYFNLLVSKINSYYKAALLGCFCVVFFNSMGNPGIGGRVFGAWIPSMYICVSIASIIKLNNQIRYESSLG